MKDSGEIAARTLNLVMKRQKSPTFLFNFELDQNVFNFVKLDDFLVLTFPILNLSMMYQQISVWRVGLDWRMVRTRFA